MAFLIYFQLFKELLSLKVQILLPDTSVTIFSWAYPVD